MNLLQQTGRKQKIIRKKKVEEEKKTASVDGDDPKHTSDPPWTISS